MTADALRSGCGSCGGDAAKRPPSSQRVTGGKRHRSGQALVEEGAIADLLPADGNPTANIALVGDPSATSSSS